MVSKNDLTEVNKLYNELSNSSVENINLNEHINHFNTKTCQNILLKEPNNSSLSSRSNILLEKKTFLRTISDQHLERYFRF